MLPAEANTRFCYDGGFALHYLLRKDCGLASATYGPHVGSGAAVAVIPNTIRHAKQTLIALSLAVAGCRAGLPAASPTPDTFALRLLVDNTAAPLLQELVGAYRDPGTRLTWEIAQGERRTVFDWLQADRAPFALITYPDDPARLETAGPNGGPLWATPVGQNGVAVIVHPTNTVADLNPAQLRGVLNGSLSNWSQLGGVDMPITLITREQDSSDAQIIQNIVLGRGSLDRRARLATTGQAMIDLVSQIPGGLGFVSTGYLSERVRPLAIEGILPTVEAITGGQYPIRAPILFVGPAEPGDDAYRAFFAWVQSPQGQGIVRKYYGGLPQAN